MRVPSVSNRIAANEVAAGSKLDALVAKLNELQRTATLEHALRVGRLIVAEMYGGDLGLWRREGEREVSFRRLAERTKVDLNMSPTSLYRSMALFDLCSRLPPELWRDFGAAHLRAVLGLPQELQVRLLSMAKVHDWSAREIYAQARQVQGRRRAGQPPTTANLRVLRRLIVSLREWITIHETWTDPTMEALVPEARELLERLDRLIAERDQEQPSLGAGKETLQLTGDSGPATLDETCLSELDEAPCSDDHDAGPSLRVGRAGR
jgi:hypothetical protein